MSVSIQPINLNEAKSNDLKTFLDSFDHVFSDCDGVLWSRTPLPGSGDFVRIMKQLGKTVHFVSNNSINSKENYESLFRATNIEDGFSNLTTPSIAIAEYLKSVNFDKQVYCVTCPETIKVLESHGFRCKDGPDNGADYYGDYVKYLEDNLDIGAVVFDSDFKVNMPKMYKAITYLRRPEVLFVSGATDRYVPLKRDSLTLGTGVFTDIVAEEVSRQPIVLGKPGKMFGEFAMRRAGISDASRVLFIGDMIEQDVGLGKATGFKTLLLLTSATREAMMSHKTLTPDYYADSLGSLVPIISGLQNGLKQTLKL